MACDCKQSEAGRWSGRRGARKESIDFEIESECTRSIEGVLGEPDAGEGDTLVCCVTYVIKWSPSGFRPGDQIRLKRFVVGGDEWRRPSRFIRIRSGARRVAQTVRIPLLCRESDCAALPAGKIEFERRGLLAWKLGALGTIGPLMVCKLS